jgi:hypothetical protein
MLQQQVRVRSLLIESRATVACWGARLRDISLTIRDAQGDMVRVSRDYSSVLKDINVAWSWRGIGTIST